MDFIQPKNRAAQGPASPPPVADRPAAPVPPAPDNTGSGSHFRNILSSVGLFASALVVAILLNTFVIQSYQVDGQSMESTLQNGDRLIVNKVPRTISRIDGHQYTPKRGDIIIFNQQGLPGFIGQKQLIKRVIGLPGDHVVTSGVETKVYNSQHPDGYNPDTSGGYRPLFGQSCGAADVYLKANEIFVMGDNRGNSEDSRCFGPITADQIVAKLEFRIMPLNKAQSF